jgi:hypothetical protein
LKSIWSKRGVDTKKLTQFLGRFVNDLGATGHAGMVVIGERLVFGSISIGSVASRRRRDLLEPMDRLNPTFLELSQAIEQEVEKCPERNG